MGTEPPWSPDGIPGCEPTLFANNFQLFAIAPLSPMNAVFRILSTLAFAAGTSASAQPFFASQTAVEIVVNPIATHAPVRVPVSTAGGFDLTSLSVSSNASWVAAAVVPEASAVELTFATQSLVTRSSGATVTLAGGGHEVQIQVEAITTLLNVPVLEPDPLRSTVYALQQDGIGRGSVLIYDPVAEAGIAFVTVGEKPTDIAISQDASEALVLCSASQEIHVIDLTTLRVVEVLPLASYEDSGTEESSGRVSYGPNGLIYYADGAWQSSIHALNRSTGEVVQSKVVGVGDFVMLPDESALMGWFRYGWNAGLSNSAIWRVPLDASGVMGAKEEPDDGPAMKRDPLNTPVLVTPDGSTVFAKQYAFDPADFPNTAAVFSGPVLAASPYGEVVSTPTGLYDVTTGNQLLDYTHENGVQAITSDYTRLVSYNSEHRELRVLEILDALVDVDFGADSVFPADGASVVPPPQLRWRRLPGVTSYRVYLGTDETAVSSAGTNDASYVGTVSSGTFDLTSRLDTNFDYYWRVDAVVGTEVIRGLVRSFFVSQVAPALRRLEGATVQPHTNFLTSIGLTGETDGLSWSASTDAPWISFNSDSGVTPATLEVSMNASLLAPGSHQTEITLTHADGTTVLPVTLSVDALALTHIRTDPDSAIAYAISEVEDQVIPRAHLLEIDTETETILRAKQVGTSVTDMAIHGPENRLYITNWAPGLVIAVDRDSFETVRTYAFRPWTQVGYGDGDPYRVAAAGAGRIVVEEYDQWIEVSLVDTATGETLADTYERQGGGVTTAGGRYYYHGDSNSSGAELLRFDLLGDVFTQLAAKRVSHHSYYGSRTVVASTDGQRIFWNGGVFTPTLEEEWSTGREIYSTNHDGSLAFGENNIYDIDARQVAFSMPVQTRVSGFNSQSNKLIVQRGDRVAFYNLDEQAPLQVPTLSGEALSDTQIELIWTEGNLEASFTLQFRLSGTEEWSELATADGFAVSYIATGLSPETAYDFQVRANSASASSDWSNVITVSTTPTPPVRPSFTSLTMTTGSAIHLTWNEGGPVDYIVLERRDPDGTYVEIARLDAPTGGSFFDTDPKQPETSYRYRLESFRDGQRSGYSYEGYFFVPALSAPRGDSLWNQISLYEGATFTRTAAVSGYPYPTIRWYRNGALLEDQTGEELRLENIDILDAGTYHYELSNNRGTWRSNDMVITVTPSEDPIAGDHNYFRHGYVPGEPIRVRSTLHYVGRVSSLGWQLLLPDGWSYQGSEGDFGSTVAPEMAQTGYVEWAWVEPPPSGTSIVFTLLTGPDSAGDQELAGLILATKSDQTFQKLLNPDPLIVPQVPWNHHADTDKDGRIGLSELLRVIEIYNTRSGTSRTGRYQTSEDTPDRYATAPDIPRDEPVDMPDFHSADVNQDARISLPELLRVIELYNVRSGTSRTGAYRLSPGSYDGFAPGAE